MKKVRKIFSESFKRDKVRLYETGKMTVSQVSKLYEVSETALYKWVDKYRTTPSSQRVVLETDSDYLQLLELQKRLDMMERLIGGQQIKLDFQRALIDSASSHYEGILKKKVWVSAVSRIHSLDISYSMESCYKQIGRQPIRELFVLISI